MLCKQRFSTQLTEANVSDILVLDRIPTKNAVLNLYSSCQFSKNHFQNEDACLNCQWIGCGIWAFSIQKPLDPDKVRRFGHYIDHDYWLVVAMS